MPFFKKTSPDTSTGTQLTGSDTHFHLDALQRIEWLRLIRSQNVGPVTFRELVNKYGSAGKAIEALPDLAFKGGARKVPVIYSEEQARAELQKAKKIGARIYAMGEKGYPPLLAHTDGAPPLLYIKGNTDLLNQPILAIVGSRNASALGCKFTSRLIGELARENFVIVSGLARGIDTAAHTAALKSGTIAVVAGSVDHFYPPENAHLQKAIADTGLLISENPVGFIPRAQDFPRRNRLISGLSSGTLVVEADKRSGSLITARLAAEQGRYVFAVPGHPLDPRAAGTNHLVREGAILIRNGTDILELFNSQMNLFSDAHDTSLNESKNWISLTSDSCSDFQKDLLDPDNEVSVYEKERLVQALGLQPVSIDDLADSTDLPASLVQSILLELDVAGRLVRQPGQLVSLKPE